MLRNNELSLAKHSMLKTPSQRNKMAQDAPEKNLYQKYVLVFLNCISIIKNRFQYLVF